ncbi:helix-turn-helix domain-containing protein [Bradyrhizobium sp. CER78]|uniref:AraC-like ligand-binding domain-containing protein n=1 Tax=Bradyrhizobium sp. CER78 TaxID=3039162 RepID=UPI002448B0B6|nr:helix-turn-helix domain-containing protein [Bradyrhizobium sp. CER78]MDH2383231.1 helix-turn-helix domain-containing protein [Bradyrhizobium sp. CER78]
MAMPTVQLADRLFQRESLVLSSDDLDEVVDGCTRALRPHQLRIMDRRATLSTTLHHLPIGTFSLNRLHYGADVIVAPAVPEEDNFLITLPLRGNARFAYGSEDASVSPGHGAIVSPYRQFRFEIGAAFDQVVLRLNRRRVETICAAMIGAAKPQSVDFQLPVTGMPAFWLYLLEAAASLSIAGSALDRARLSVQLEELIIQSLLLSLPNNFTNSILAASRHASTAQVRRAIEYMRDHIEEPIRLTDVARHAGLSLRSLQLAFQREFGTSPGRWLRTERLDRVHAILSSAAPGSVSVTDVALRWGFLHLGEFAAHYKTRYGRRPSDVLAKRT